jgi:L-fuculose-phosphate aldolase
MRPAQTGEELLEQLAEVGRLAVSSGLALASGGNLSARLPGRQEFFVTAAGTWLDRLTASSFSVMSLDGEVAGGAERPSSEWKLHQRTYRARPDVNAIIHLHPQHAVLVDALGHRIRLITLDHAYYVRSVGLVPYYPNGSTSSRTRPRSSRASTTASFCHTMAARPWVKTSAWRTGGR